MKQTAWFAILLLGLFAITAYWSYSYWEAVLQRTALQTAGVVPLIGLSFLFWRYEPSSHGHSRWIGLILSTLGGTLCVFGVFNNELWLVWLGTIGLCSLFIGRFRHRRDDTTAWPILWLLGLTVFPSLESVSGLLEYAEDIAQRAASFCLDRLGIMHVMAPNSVDLASGALDLTFRDSPFTSIYALMVFAGVLSVWYYRSLVQGMLLVMAAILWGLVMHAGHWVAVTYVASNFGQEVLIGFNEGLLRYGLLAIACLALVSTDRLIYLITGPILEHDDDVMPGRILNPLIFWYNRAVGGGVGPWHRRPRPIYAPNIISPRSANDEEQTSTAELRKSTKSDQPIYGDLGTGSEPGLLLPGTWYSGREVAYNVLNLVTCWWYSRPWQRLWVASPVIAVVLALCVFLSFRSQSTESFAIRNWYDEQLAQAKLKGEWDVARIACDALLVKYPLSNDYWFERSTIAQQLNDETKEIEILEKLTPIEKPGHLAARKAIVGKYMQQKELERALQQLEKAHQEAPRDQEVRSALGQLLIAFGKTTRGLELLELAAAQDSFLRMQLADIYVKLNRTNEAHRHFQSAANELQRLWKSKATESVGAFAIEATRRSQDWKEAEELAREVREQFPESLPIKEAHCRLLVDRAKAFGIEGKTFEQWQYLEQTIAISPNHLPALSLIAELAFSKGKVADQANEVIDKLIDSGNAPPAVHLILGTRAAQVGEIEKATHHLKQAQSLNPQAPVVLNNLSWVLTQKEPPQLDQALMLVEEAIKLSPNIPDMYDTRATIRMMQANPQQAITDWERALILDPENPKYQARVAQAYREAGDHETADRIEARLDSRSKVEGRP